MTFLIQVKKEEDKEVRDTIIEETHATVRTLIDKLVNTDSKTDAHLDWILISCVKWLVAADNISIPKEFQFCSLSDTLAQQINKKVSKLNKLMKYEKPETAENLSAADK